MRTLLLLALVMTVPQATPPQATPPQATPPKPPQATSTAATKPGSIDLTVTSLTGTQLADASVKAEGPVSRQGSTGADGDVVLSNVPPGTYRCRIEKDGYITLEKEVTVKTGTRVAAEASLSTAPPPPPPPAPPQPVEKTPPPPPAPPPLLAGEPKVLSVPDVIEGLVKSTDVFAERPLGCSGATAGRVIRVRDELPRQTHPDEDEFLYVVAGDATLQMGGKAQEIGPGWLGLIPRGTAYSMTVRGKNPVYLLSIVSGPACGDPK